jgi:hypothetical protein
LRQSLQKLFLSNNALVYRAAGRLLSLSGLLFIRHQLTHFGDLLNLRVRIKTGALKIAITWRQPPIVLRAAHF